MTQEEFEEIIIEERKKLVGSITQFVGDEAEDVFHNFIVSVWEKQNFERFVHKGGVYTALQNWAKNYILKDSRRRAREVLWASDAKKYVPGTDIEYEEREMEQMSQRFFGG